MYDKQKFCQQHVLSTVAQCHSLKYMSRNRLNRNRNRCGGGLQGRLARPEGSARSMQFITQHGAQGACYTLKMLFGSSAAAELLAVSSCLRTDTCVGGLAQEVATSMENVLGPGHCGWGTGRGLLRLRGAVLTGLVSFQ